MHTKTLTVFFLVLAFIQGSAQTTTKKEKLVHTVDSVIQTQIENNIIPGAVIEIKQGNTVLYKHAYGYAQKYTSNMQVLNPPDTMTVDDMFDIASLTKVIGTTTSIMLLQDKGLLNVDDKAGKYISAFTSDDKKEITIRHLLTHTAGLYEWYPLFYRSSDKQSTFNLIGSLPLAFPVGQQRKYSDLGFTILGEIVEKISGLPLDSFMQQQIFIPLGMQHTTFNPLKKGFTKFAATSHGNPYETRMVHDTTFGFVFKEIDPDSWNGWRHYTLRGEVNDGNAWYASGGVCGAAGLFSTVDDLQKLVDMLKNHGKAGNKQFISEETIQLFLTKDNFNNGLGWMMDNNNSFMKNAPAESFGHTGFTGTSIAVVPKYNISVILLINRQNMGLLPSGQYYNPNPIREAVFNAAMNYCK